MPTPPSPPTPSPATSSDVPRHHGGLHTDLVALHAQASREPTEAHPARRQALGWLLGLGGIGGIGAVGSLAGFSLVGCGGGGDASNVNGTSTNPSSTVTASDGNGGSCSTLPTETQGPYPADGSNSVSGSVVNALTLSGIVRSDIRTSVGSASGTAAGVPLTVRVRLVNVNANCAVLSGWAIYLWHCTREGKYSLYSSGLTGENHLRGVQATDSTGTATFVTIFPGCYSGRMPHIHFEAYRSLSTATSASNKLLTSQMAFPVSTCQDVYNNASGYSASIANLAQMSFATDNVFSDGYSTQLVTLTGDVSNGYVATITVGMSV